MVRCQVVPLPDAQVALLVDGLERLRWHHGPSAPRPFFYPLIGPSGTSLTRMGHPGAPNHDHHRSIWFGHHKVLGIDFWSEQTAARVRQTQWLAFEDGDEEALMAVRLAWLDGHDPEALLEQDLVAALRPGANQELELELQSTWRPMAETLELGQTNFGMLAVRVAKSLSAHFGGGQLTDSEGRSGEPEIFGQQARWVDYSGPVSLAPGWTSDISQAGITYFDHPDNVRYPSYWHVREDGWMGASLCMHAPLTLKRAMPLTLRYLLHAHRGAHDHQRAEQLAASFAARPALLVERSQKKHRHFEARRM